MPTTHTLLLALAFTLSVSTASAQSHVWTPYAEVDMRPAPYEGFDRLAEQAPYPELARRAGITGTVRVLFTVDENGIIVSQADSDDAIGPVCYQDPGGGTCEASLRAVRAAVLSPGFVGDRAVAVEECFAFEFGLADGKGSAVVTTVVTAAHCE